MRSRIDAPSAVANLPGGGYHAGRLSDEPARQLAEMGKGFGKLGDALLKIELKEKQENDRTRVNDALNQLGEARTNLLYGENGLMHQKGENAIKRESGMLLSDEGASQLSDIAKGLEQNMTPDQIRMFRESAGGMISATRQDLTRHLGREKVGYDISVNNTSLQKSLNELAIASVAGNRDTAIMSRNTADVAFDNLAYLNGWTGEQLEEVKRKAYSDTGRKIVSQFVGEGNWEKAEKWVSQNEGMFNADDLFYLQDAIKKQKTDYIAEQYAVNVYRDLEAKGASSPFNQSLIDITLYSESRGKDFADNGKPLTSSAGAKYAMQVMPAVAKNPGFGITPAKDDSPAEYNRVGRELLAVHYKRYDGDLEKMWAAYNYGHGNVDKLIEKHGADWKQHLPAETKKYLRDNMGMLVAHQRRTTGQVVTPNKRNMDEVIGASVPEEYQELVKEKAHKYWDQQVKNREEESDYSLSILYDQLRENGGDITKCSPDLTMRLTAEDHKKFNSFATSMAKGVSVDNPDVVLRLHDPAYLTSLSDSQFKDTLQHLRMPTWQRFAKQRAKLLQGSEVGSFQLSKLEDRIFKEQVLQMGMSITPRREKEKLALMNMRTFVRDFVDTEASKKGSPLSQEEVEKAVYNAFSKQIFVKDSFLWFDADENMMTMDVDDIPKSERWQIENYLKRNGHFAPSPSLVLRTYRRMVLQNEKG